MLKKLFIFLKSKFSTFLCSYPVGPGTSVGIMWICSQLSSALFCQILLWMQTEIDHPSVEEVTDYYKIQKCNTQFSFVDAITNKFNKEIQTNQTTETTVLSSLEIKI